METVEYNVKLARNVLSMHIVCFQEAVSRSPSPSPPETNKDKVPTSAGDTNVDTSKKDEAAKQQVNMILYRFKKIFFMIKCLGLKDLNFCVLKK